MKDKIDFNTILNFTKGKYSYNDYLKVKHWFSRVEDNKELKEKLFAQWKELIVNDNGSEDSLHHIFEKIQYTILLEEKKRNMNRSIWRYYRQAAAILLIPVLAFSLWYYMSAKSPQSITPELLMAQSWIEINAPDGARVEFLLPDSSRGWLNNGGKLKYPAVFTRHRLVELTGEAYFDVKHLNQSDFVVSVSDMDIKVLGTKFNVSAYSDESTTSVVLVEGKVEIKGKAGVFNHTLLPDEKITFNREKKTLDLQKVNKKFKEQTLNLQKVEVNPYTAWKDGYLIIDNEPFDVAVGKIERWYNTEVIIQGEMIKKYKLRATFKDEPLEEVLRLISLTTPIKYSIEKRVADSNGVLKQKKVTIKLK